MRGAIVSPGMGRRLRAFAVAVIPAWMVSAAWVADAPLQVPAVASRGGPEHDAGPRTAGWETVPDGAVRGRCPTGLYAGRHPGPEYYRFPMVSTRRVPGTGRAAGVGEITFSASPFGVTVTDNGSYGYDFTLRLERLARPRAGTYVVWTATPSLDVVALAGELTDGGVFTGHVRWNKFLVVVTLEPELDASARMWSGPIVMRGMSRSGMMHTMAGHGPFEEENCAAYGY